MLDVILGGGLLAGSVIVVSSLRFTRWVLERQDRQDRLDKQLDQPTASNVLTEQRLKWFRVWDDRGQPDAVREQARVRVLELDKRLMDLEG